jgi:hypothetical protein
MAEEWVENKSGQTIGASNLNHLKAYFKNTKNPNLMTVIKTRGIVSPPNNVMMAALIPLSTRFNS